MADVTTVGTFLDNLRDRLMERGGLVGVECFTAAVDHLSIGKEALVFAVDPTAVSFEYQTLPKKVLSESYPVEGRTWVVKPGGGESAIKAARDRALELFSEVVDEVTADNTQDGSLNATANCQATLGVDEAHLSGFRLEQYVADGGRDCRVIFTISVETKFTPD